jgi:histidine triad (HIT) family protein
MTTAGVFERARYVRASGRIRLMGDDECPFCDVLESDIVATEGPCVAIWTNELPRGSLMVIPREHRREPWDLSAQEWSATQVLLRAMKRRVGEVHHPDGWSVGWNVGLVGGQTVEHAHCHLVPRYRQELHAGKGLRWWLKQPENEVDPRPGG